MTAEADRQRRLREEAARKRRLAEVFGDVVPEQTRDDAEPSEEKAGDRDEWFRRQVPPHHGD